MVVIFEKIHYVVKKYYVNFLYIMGKLVTIIMKIL